MAAGASAGLGGGGACWCSPRRSRASAARPVPGGPRCCANATHQAPFEIVLRDPVGRRYAGGIFEEVYVFDTQFTDREKQCVVGRDGGFEVLRPDGEVIASQDFDDRPLCEFDELVLEDDGSLVWK